MGEQVAAGFIKENIPNGGVAQLGEHLPCKQGVKSSNLSVSTELKKYFLIQKVSGLKETVVP